MTKTLTLITTGLLALTIWTVGQFAQAANTSPILPSAPVVVIDETPARPAVVTVHESNTGPIDVEPPQRLDVVGLDLDECNHSGGVLLDADPDAPAVCQGVDY